MKLDELNRMHGKYMGISGAEFAIRVLQETGVSYHIPEHQLQHIPRNGAFILVANHHYGALDGLILEAIVGSVRPDLKILTTFFLTLIPGLRDSFIPVDNFSTDVSRSVSGIRASVEHLKSGHALGLFPAGEVATWQRRKNRTSIHGRRVVEDKPWAPGIVKLIKNSGLPVIPVYFDGGNSRLFHILGCIHPRLRTLRLVHEMLNKRGSVIEVRIGQPVPATETLEMDIPLTGRYLRNRSYALAAQCVPEMNVSDCRKHRPLAEPMSPEIIRKEMERVEERILFESGDYRVYLLRTTDAPCAMRELYRLREEAFRGVGEGTDRPLDSDKFDSRYLHLILWNIPDGAIAGAYRIGNCRSLMGAYGGIQGIYTASLYRYKQEAARLLSGCMELGRSFIVPKYQREVHALRILLAGLSVSTLTIPGADCFLGPVSISDDYPKFYKSLIVRFLERDFQIPETQRLVEPPHPFIPDFLSVNPDDLLQAIPKGDIDHFDRLLASLSDGRFRLPVLVRKYFSCSARLACFNVDPDFRNSLDGLILLRLSDFPIQILRSILRGVPDELRERVYTRFYGNPEP